MSETSRGSPSEWVKRGARFTLLIDNSAAGGKKTKRSPHFGKKGAFVYLGELYREFDVDLDERHDCRCHKGSKIAMLSLP